jgi:PAS domain S-box-containing protein
VKDAARRKTLVNPADLRNMGVASEAEVLGKTDFDLFPPDLAAAFDADDQYVIQTGQPILNREEGITRPDGSRGWQLTSKVPLRDSNGQVIGLVGIGHDITERKQAEETLAAERLLLRAIIDIMPALVYVKDTTGRKILANPVDLDYMGVSTEAEALGKTDFDFYPQEMAAQFYDRDQAIMQTGQPLISYEHNLVRGDGQERWLLTSKVPLRDSTGQIIGLVGTGLDITERKRAEEALQESEERFHSLYENSTIGLYRTTLGGEILLANPALVKMLGYASFEALAARDLSKDGYGLMYNRAEFLEAVEKEGEIKGLESSWIRQDGQAIFIRESTRAIRDAQGKTLYYDGTVEDITERKRAQAEILRNAEQLATTIDVQHTLAATLDERAIWTRLGHGVQQLFPDMATVFISSYDPERTVISAEYGLQDGEPVDLSALPPILLSPPGRGTQSQVIHTRQPLVIASGLKERVSQGNVVVRVGEGEEDTQSAVYVPMLIQDKVLGVIQLQSYTPERFRETDVRLLALVANTAAVSIQNARLYALAQNEIAEREQAEQVIARRARELQTLYESSQQLKRTLDPEEIYHTIHHFIAQTIPCSGLFISDYSADPALITCRAAWNDGVWLDVADFPPIPLEPEGQGTQSVAIRTGQSLLLNDYERHVAASRARYYVDNEGALYEEVPDDAPRTRSALIVPLEVEGRVTGVIQVFSDSVNAFSEDHLHLLESLAIHIATSLQNAALYQAAQREITERKRTETMLREAQELYRSLFEQSPDAVFILDLQGQHIEVNARAAELLAYTKPELLTRSVREISAEPDKSTEILNRLQAGEAIPPYEQLFRRKDGSLVPVELHISLIRDSQGRPLQIQSIARDITERKRAAELLRMYTEQLEALVAERTRALEEAQERLLRQERLTVLGQVAGGIAHELRTPLGAIKNSIYLLNMLLEPSDATVQEVLAVINQEIGASDRIISSLLNFTRPQRPARQIVDVHQVVEQALVRIEIPPQFQVQRHFAQDMPAILADAVQLEQVFGNLILNATQAMSQEGQLTIQTGQIHSLPENVEAGFMPTDEAHAAGWVVVSISDTGDGISPKHLAQLFQPLFTTKSKGMGLGLALVKLLTEANGGGIAVESTLGKGTTFHTFWPIATQ